MWEGRAQPRDSASAPFICRMWGPAWEAQESPWVLRILMYVHTSQSQPLVRAPPLQCLAQPPTSESPSS